MSSSDGNRDDVIHLDVVRFERLTNAVALASAGAYDEAISALSDFQPDRFGEIEEMLRVFFVELKETNYRIEEVIFQLEKSREELETRVQTIEQKEAMIRELGTPIIDVWDGIIAMPVIGSIDTARASEMSEKLLHKIADNSAEWVIVDLTGVTGVDAATAEHLLRLAQMTNLLGSQCILTGMTSAVARSVVDLGLDVSAMKPFGSLKEGLRHCIARQRAARPSAGPTR